MNQALVNPELVNRVERLQADYVDCIDDERYADWPGFFLEECLYTIISRDNARRGLPFGFLWCENRRMLRDRIASMKNANIYEPHTYRHVLGRTSVRPAEAGGWRARTSYMLARVMHDGGMDLFSTGAYEDWIVEDEGTLRFREKRVVTDSGRIDALIVIPF
ncbi:terephthalate 1,2-dioxygenase [Pigmentiphaga sp. H8]|uniref:aromatic-ring-hydroxylating dioxygenase subunit beta n=1 Tax=unclassified Pigmentiphaga TaxID=2626614 RepID=UPI000F5ACF2A|nr:aromatic-ring-hydroxylating dioxygenase subunit beta [Pigmentiphaga sp. H8]AZG06812.1 terephthalate 1,2-dioxygenase [Pigmentiphaga sp. H8]